VVLCRWDLDKTYLRSEFDTVKQLLRTAFERGEDKVELPGVAEVIKGIKESAAREGRSALVYFLSASPPQIGRAIRDKLALDGVPYDGIAFKDQLGYLRRGKLRSLREHVGFKLVHLLRGRLEAPLEARELLFGDDWESDSLIYALYADVIGGRIGPERLRAVLRRIGVDPALITNVLALAPRAAGHDAVDRIFINLERRTPPAMFHLFGTRLVPTFNYFQTAAVLAGDGIVDGEVLARVGAVLVERAGYTPQRLVNSLDDLVRRGHLAPSAANALAPGLRARGLLPRGDRPVRWRGVLAALRGLRVKRTGGRAARPAPPEVIDYDAILDRVGRHS
jgi:hypothetical protein